MCGVGRLSERLKAKEKKRERGKSTKSAHWMAYFFERSAAVSELAKRIEAFSQRSLAAGKHRSVAQSVGACFGFAQFLDQVKEIRRVVSLKGNHKFLII